MTRHPTTAAPATAAALVTLLLTGCTTTGPATGTPAAVPTNTPTSTATPTSSAPSDSAPGPEEWGDERVDPPTQAEATTADADAAITQAEGLLTAFLADDGSTPHAWYRTLRPYLTAYAREAYRYTDPGQVPATTITGPGTVHPDGTVTAVAVDVPTGLGTFTILLVRPAPADTWLADRIVFPES